MIWRSEIEVGEWARLVNVSNVRPMRQMEAAETIQHIRELHLPSRNNVSQDCSRKRKDHDRTGQTRQIANHKSFPDTKRVAREYDQGRIQRKRRDGRKKDEETEDEFALMALTL
jgi:hypothetical protein